MKQSHSIKAIVFSTMLMLLISGSTSAQNKEKYPSFMHGDIPNGINYLPTPPDTSSMNFFNDYVQYNWGKTQRAGERGKQAAFDAILDVDSVLLGFSEAFGMPLSTKATPAISELVKKTMGDAGTSTMKIKNYYRRKRPFVQFKESTLMPEHEKNYIKSPSYPSGHSATGWGVALILSELNPARAEEILKRGYEFGQSRVIAGYHYQSDVDVARMAASAAIARIHTSKEFKAALEKAQKEFAKLQKAK